MRYVIINELYSMGGSEVQSLREMKVMRTHGHEVMYITFDPNFPEGPESENRNHVNLVSSCKRISKKAYRMFTDPSLYKRLNKLLTDFNPDYIHVNNAVNNAPAIYKAVGNFCTFQTIRDYGAVCPTGLCVGKEYKVCEGKRYHCCTLRCMPREKKPIFVYYNMVSGFVARSRQRNIKLFVSPSQRLTEYCNTHGLPTICVNNPFDFSFLHNFQKELDRNKKTYLFYGFVAEHKGIRQLLNAFERFSQGKNCELLIAGKISPDMRGEVKTLRSNIHYIGVKKYSEIIELLKKVYAVVVPSLWMENYPNTVLEGLCTECLVLASDRGGMKEMIRDERFIFDVLDQSDIVSKLDFSYELSEEEYKEIVEGNLSYVKQNNSIETYYFRIMDVLRRLDTVKGTTENAENNDTFADARNLMGGGQSDNSDS